MVNMLALALRAGAGNGGIGLLEAGGGGGMDTGIFSVPGCGWAVAVKLKAEKITE